MFGIRSTCRSKNSRLVRTVSEPRCAIDGMDVLLLYGNGLDECGYPTYVSNYTVKLPFAALVIAARGRRPDSDVRRIDARAERGPGDHLDRRYATLLESSRRPASAALTEKQPSERCHRTRRCPTADAVRSMGPAHCSLAGAKLMDAEPFVDKLRSVKSDPEIAQVRAASKIVHTTFDDLESPHFEAVTESLLAARLIRHARMQGAEDVRVMIANPLDSDLVFRPPEDSAIAESETIVVLLRASWERYWAEATRPTAFDPDASNPSGATPTRNYTTGGSEDSYPAGP